MENEEQIGGLAPSAPRVPPAVNGVDVNHCKNPACKAFGLPVAQSVKRGRGADNAHTVVATGKGLPAIRCNACGAIYPMKSNVAVVEETERMGAVFLPAEDPSCPEAGCANHGVPVSAGKASYSSFGKTSTGSPRWKCKGCGKTFSAPARALHRQRKSHKNRDILKDLVNKMPLRRICESNEISPDTLYRKIGFLHGQAVAFAADRERRLRDKGFDRLYLAVDRQDHRVNWSERETKKNTTVSALTTADDDTGYVFAVHLNYDPDADRGVVEQEGIAAGDPWLPPPHRLHARLWSESDHDRARRRKMLREGVLESDIGVEYAEAIQRDDIEVPDVPRPDDKLPDEGMLVHAEYTMHGHFRYIRNLFGSVGKFRLFLDQDSGMRAACLSAFADRVADGTCDAFYVRISKDLTVDEKRKLKAEAKKELGKRMKASGKKEKEIRLEMLKERVAEARAVGPFGDQWVFMPFPDMSEPEKAVCPLTTLDGMDDDHVAHLLDKASLHAVDSFFNRTRRRVAMLERSIRSSSNDGRVYHLYAAYSPAKVQAMMDIFRTVHNYVLVGDDGKTPAMRLGLARGPVDYEDIIYHR
ncbi:MAG: transposase [Burkholderiales bacterium]